MTNLKAAEESAEKMMQRKWPMDIFDLYGWIEHWKRNLTIYEMIGQQDRSLDQLKHLN